MKRWWSCIVFTFSHAYLGQPVKLHLEFPFYRQGKRDTEWFSCLLRSHRLSCVQTDSPVLSPVCNLLSHSLSSVSTGFWLRAQRRRTEASGNLREGFWEKRRQWGTMKEEGWIFVSKKKHSTGHFGYKRRNLGRHLGTYLTSCLWVSRQSQRPHCSPASLLCLLGPL